ERGQLVGHELERIEGAIGGVVIADHKHGWHGQSLPPRPLRRRATGSTAATLLTASPSPIPSRSRPPSRGCKTPNDHSGVAARVARSWVVRGRSKIIRSRSWPLRYDELPDQTPRWSRDDSIDRPAY